MPITIAFLGSSRHVQPERVALRLCKLLMELPPPAFILLDWLGAQIELVRNAPPVRRFLHPRKILLDIVLFEGAVPGRRRFCSKSHSRALDSLKRQTIELLDAEFRFTDRRDWRLAARNDLKGAKQSMPSAAQSDRVNSLSVEAARTTRIAPLMVVDGIIKRVTRLLANEPDDARRLLCDILLLRDQLRETYTRREPAADHMQQKFPGAYPLALSFEAMLEHPAAQVAIRRHPELAAQPVAAMRAVRRELKITWPPGVPPPSLDDC